MASDSTFSGGLFGIICSLSCAIIKINLDLLESVFLVFSQSLDTTNFAEMALNIVCDIALAEGVPTIAGVSFKDHTPVGLMLMLNADS